MLPPNGGNYAASGPMRTRTPITDNPQNGAVFPVSRAQMKRPPGWCARAALDWGFSRWGSSVAVGALAVRHGVETFALLLLGYAQSDRQIDDLVRDQRDDAAPEDGDADTPSLRDHVIRD